MTLVYDIGQQVYTNRLGRPGSSSYTSYLLCSMGITGNIGHGTHSLKLNYAKNYNLMDYSRGKRLWPLHRIGNQYLGGRGCTSLNWLFIICRVTNEGVIIAILGVCVCTWLYGVNI